MNMKKTPTPFADHSNASAARRTAVKGVTSILAWITKFNNDWVLSFASGLAFNLVTAFIPIVIAILALAGFMYGGLNPAIQEELLQHMQSNFPPPLPSQESIGLALTTLNQDAGVLALIAIVMAIFGGMGLFLAMEGKFALVYHIRTRGIIRQYLMALGMLLVFVVLSPLVIFADTFPSVVDVYVQTTPLGQSATSGIGMILLTMFCGLVATWILLEMQFVIVPNQHISFRDSWFGALLAAVAVQAYLQLFPFYATHFLRGYTGTVGFAIIFLFFFYYFGVILLAGAEINAFYAQGKRALPENLAVMVHDVTQRVPKGEEEVQDKQGT
jgi:membrane protein